MLPINSFQVTREAEPLTAASSYPWFAIRVKSNFESVAASGLRGRGLEEFLPQYRVRRRWSDRVRTLDLPLFPGYVFCRFDPQDRLPVLTTPGVLHVVGFANQPAPIDDNEIAAIQNLVKSGLPAEPWPFLRVGQRVRVSSGPLTGTEGIVVQLKQKCRLIVSVSLLQRSVAVEIDRDCITPI
jgi:Transcription antiterminator